MRAIGHHQFRPKTSDRLPGSIEPRKRRERGIRAAVTVGRENTSETHTGGGHIGGAEFQVAKIVIKASAISAYIAVAKICVDYARGEQLHLVPRGHRGEIVLEPLHVDGSV